ncbi:MAG: hypothetical protein AB1555_00070 [Nitrospirota bacterium]
MSCSEIANAPEEPNESDPVVLLRPRETWTTAKTKSGLVDAIRRRLADIPGISVLMSQPIQERVDELISGIRTECAIKFQLILRFPEVYRNSVGAIGEIRVKAATGAPIPLSELATIEMRE